MTTCPTQSNGLQQDLDFSETDVDHMVKLLDCVAMHGERITAAEFKILQGWTERKCRLIAEASGGRIIGTPSGYALNLNLTEAAFQSEYIAYWRKSFIQGLVRLKKAKEFRYGLQQPFLRFIDQMAREEGAV